MFSIFLHINLADVVRAIIWTFFHSLWFAIVVGAGIILLQILIHKASPLVKHLTYSLIFGLAIPSEVQNIVKGPTYLTVDE